MKNVYNITMDIDREMDKRIIKSFVFKNYSNTPRYIKRYSIVFESTH